MRYQELYDEYSALLRRQTELQTKMQKMPIGYITKRKISGKEYHYLQHTHLGKKHSECLREDRVQEIRAALKQRDEIGEQIAQMQEQLNRLEEAARILDAGLSRAFYFLKPQSILLCTCYNCPGGTSRTPRDRRTPAPVGRRKDSIL